MLDVNTNPSIEWSFISFVSVWMYTKFSLPTSTLNSYSLSSSPSLSSTFVFVWVLLLCVVKTTVNCCHIRIYSNRLFDDNDDDDDHQHHQNNFTIVVLYIIIIILYYIFIRMLIVQLFSLNDAYCWLFLLFIYI